MKLLVGADVGGTKIAIRLASEDGATVLDATYRADGWEASPVEPAARWLLSRIARALSDVGESEAEIAAIGIGAQGCDTHAHCVELAAAVEAMSPGVQATVVNDAALLIPAAGLDAGIGLIAGTGSIAVGADEDGVVLFAGGWGWVLGDEGSAPAIVREATKLALAAHDEGRADDGLLTELLAHFAVPDPQTLARAVNDHPTPENWGPAAPAVFRAADAGSPLANSVIAAAARHLALLVTRLIARGAVGTTVMAAGSVVVNQPRLADHLRAAVAETHPAVTLRLLDVPPVAGAMALALALARRTPHI